MDPTFEDVYDPGAEYKNSHQTVPLPVSDAPPILRACFALQNPGPNEYMGRETDIDIIAIPAIGADPKLTWASHAPPPSDLQPIPFPSVAVNNTSPKQDAASRRKSVAHIDSAGDGEPLVVPARSMTAGNTSPFLDSFGNNESSNASAIHYEAKGTEEDRPSLERAKPLPESSEPQGPPPISKTAYPVATEWLGQPLRDDVPRARILHYRHPVHFEYDLEDYARCLLRLILDTRSKFSLPTYLRNRRMRPTLFICHSVGGLVLKKALVLANTIQNEACRQLIRDSVGICFFATPHAGSAILSNPRYSQGIAEVMGLKYPDQENTRIERMIKSPLSSAVRQELNPANPALADLTNAFAPIATSTSRIWSFVETKDTVFKTFEDSDHGDILTSIARKIVTRSSAILSTKAHPISKEILEEVHSDHIRLCCYPAEPALYARSFRIGLQNFLSNVIQQKIAQEDLVVKQVHVQIHDFLRDELSESDASSGMIVSSVKPAPTLYDFLEKGPTTLIRETREQFDMAQDYSVAPAVIIRPPSSAGNSISSNISDELVTPSNFSGLQLPPESRVQARVDENEQIREPSPERAPVALADEVSGVFKWIHVPFTCPKWVPDVLDRIMRERDGRDVNTTLLSQVYWTLRQNRARHQSPHARFMKPMCSMIDAERSQMVVYLPYLHWDTFKSFRLRAQAIKDRLALSKTATAGNSGSPGKSIETEIIRQYLVGDEPLHPRRTLDQFGFPMLRNTDARDLDQILFKRTRPELPRVDLGGTKTAIPRIDTSGLDSHRREPGPEDDNAKMLMVDTLWLWVLDEDSNPALENVITFFPPKEKDSDADDYHQIADLHDSIFNEVNSQGTPDYTAKDFAALVVCNAIEVLLGWGLLITVDRDLEVFRIFEEYINYLTEKQTQSFKNFRNRLETQSPHVKKTKNKAERDQTAAVQDEWDEHDFTALLEFRDIEDELGTLTKLFQKQNEVVLDMMKLYDDRSRGYDILQSACETLEGYLAQVHEMVERAAAGHESAKTLLDMKQKQANVDEARQARVQAQQATGQSRIILIFTIFTVIFLPLSFFTSLFGMNVREWSGTQSNVSLHTTVVYMCAISFGLIFVAFLLAFSASVREYFVLLPFLFTWIGTISLRTLRLYPVYLKLKRGIQLVWLRIGPNPRGPLATLMLKLAMQRDQNAQEKSDVEWAAASGKFTKKSRYEK